MMLYVYIIIIIIIRSRAIYSITNCCKWVFPKIGVAQIIQVMNDHDLVRHLMAGGAAAPT